MPEKEPPLVVNLDSLETKRRLVQKISKLKGLYEISIKPRKKVRSLSQNAYYWSAFVQPWAEWLREEWGDPTITTTQAHIELKKAVLGLEVKLNERTGETLELVPESHTMDQTDFGIFLDKATEFLGRAAGIVVLPSELFFEEREKRAS